MEDVGAHVPASFQRAVPLHDFEAFALSCRTRQQFHQLLNRLHALVPYKNLICSWGYPSSASLGFVLNHSFPREFVRWYLTKGMLWKSPVFQEWLQTKRTQMWLDVARHRKAQFDPEVLERVERWHLQYMLCGGLINDGLFVGFAVSFASEQSCRKCQERFDITVPILCKALRCAYPRPLLTSREITILQRRAMGEIIKQIASEEGIADRTVRMHLGRIKKKLYTDDVVNAVMIANNSGMFDQTWKRRESDKPSHSVTARTGVRTLRILERSMLLVPVSNPLSQENA